MNQENCDQSELLSLYIDGHLDGEQIRTVSQHVDDCERCRHDLEQIRILRMRLNALSTPSVPPNPQFWADAYRSARLESHSASEQSRFPWLANVFKRPLVSGAAVCVLGLILAVPFISSRYGSVVDNIGPASVSSTEVDIAPMLRSHTAYTAVQPLTDDPRISMILSDEASENEGLPVDDQPTTVRP